MGLGKLISIIMSLILMLVTGRALSCQCSSQNKPLWYPLGQIPLQQGLFLHRKGPRSFLGAEECGRRGCCEQVPQYGNPLRTTQGSQSQLECSGPADMGVPPHGTGGCVKSCPKWLVHLLCRDESGEEKHLQSNQPI